MDPNSICRKSRHIGGKQHEICQKQPEIVREVANGARMSIQECQVQFAQRKWNCSTTHKRSLHKIMKLGKYQAFIIICCLILLYFKKKNIFVTTLNCRSREKSWHETNAIFWNNMFFSVKCNCKIFIYYWWLCRQDCGNIWDQMVQRTSYGILNKNAKKILDYSVI